MGLIAEHCLQRIQDASDLVQVAEGYGLQLKPGGTNMLALCPFHNEKTPSFNINPRDQYFKCFGCGEKGTVFTFVQKMERCEFPDAVQILAERAGIELEYDGGGRGDDHRTRSDTKKSLRWATSIACDYFERCLHDPQEGKQALDYLRSRGFTDATIRRWRLGWAPDAWEGLKQHYLQIVERRGGTDKQEKAIAVGLGAGIFRQKNDDPSRVYDAFRGRVMFPIFDTQNRPIGFGGRVLEEKPEAGGKYLNTSEGELFTKRQLMYGLNFAAKEIGLQSCAIVVEGYTDTIMCHQHGIEHVVATLGTSLTYDHIRLLRRYIRGDGKVIALFDSDAAGQKATLRAIDMFMEEDVPLHIVQTLEVKDACDYLPRFGAEAFQEALHSARESFAFRLNGLLGQDFGGDVAARTAAVETLMDLVNRCPNKIKQSMMRREVARVSGVAEADLPKPKPVRSESPRTHEAWSAPQPAERRGLRPNLSQALNDTPSIAPAPAVDPHQGRRRTEERLLRFMHQKRTWCERIADEYPPDHWLDEDCHRVATMLRDGWNAHPDEHPNLSRLLKQCGSEEVSRLLIDLLGDEPQNEAEPSDAELGQILTRLRIADLEETRNRLKEEQALAEAINDQEQINSLLARIVAVEKDIREANQGSRAHARH